MSLQDPGKGRDTTRTRILETARELFGRVGFDGATVREIAKQVGITDAALYYHFRSKREILTSLWMVPVGGDVGGIQPDGAFTPNQLDRITLSAIDFCAANDDILRIMCREALSGDLTAAALRGDNRASLRRTLQEHFGTVLSQPEAELRTEAVMALLTGATIRTQLEAGANFPAVAASRPFRTRSRRWVRAIARLEESEAS
jgi:AcrR family transcriptional regulator